jgi:hypothetical protein
LKKSRRKGGKEGMEREWEGRKEGNARKLRQKKSAFYGVIQLNSLIRFSFCGPLQYINYRGILKRFSAKALGYWLWGLGESKEEMGMEEWMEVRGGRV